MYTPCCYVCLEEGGLMASKPCDCSGSIGIHYSCLERVQTYRMSCSICKKLYNHVCDGSHTTHYSDGKYIVYTTSNGIRHGKLEEYNEAGLILKRSHYNSGVLHGPYCTYHEDGSIMVECEYVDGKKEGSFVEYDEDSFVISRRQYRGDKCDGPCYEYYDGEDQKLFQKYCMIDGVLDGEFCEYDMDGSLVLAATYCQGSREDNSDRHRLQGNVV